MEYQETKVLSTTNLYFVAYLAVRGFQPLPLELIDHRQVIFKFPRTVELELEVRKYNNGAGMVDAKSFSHEIRNCRITAQEFKLNNGEEV
jgi:hypothetical protein